jgi:deoxyribonuclease V
VDAHYRPTGGARAALVVAADLSFATVVAERITELAEVAPYRPGQFASRELPAIRAVLTGAGRIDLLVVDGYVQLDPDGRPGLGAHVHACLGAPVIGVAKTAFHTASHAVEVRRGQARRPLYVTVIGIPDIPAAAIVEQMSGPYRLPDAVRRVDALTRGSSATSPPASQR